MENKNKCEDCIHYKLCREKKITNNGVMPFCRHFEPVLHLTKQEKDLMGCFGTRAIY